MTGPTPDAIARGRELSDLADAIERARMLWHAARQARDDAYRELHHAERVELLAEQEYRAAVAAYEARK